MGFLLKVAGLVLLIAVSSGCSDDVEKPVTEKSHALSTMVGVWFLDCWFDDDTDLFHQDWEEKFNADMTFEWVTTLYNAPDCNSNAVGRVIYKGTYALHDPFETDVPFLPNKKTTAWQIDFDIKEVEVLGNKLIAQAGEFVRQPGRLLDIIAVEGSIKYDGQSDYQIRPTELRYTSDRIDALNNIPLIQPPVYDTPPVASDLIGEWYDGCFNDTNSDGGAEYQERSIVRVLDNIAIQFETSVWNDMHCVGTMVASLTLSGTFSIVDFKKTPISEVPSVIVKIELEPNVTYTGDQSVAETSLRYSGYAGGTYYMRMFYDATYDMFFYGGWLEDSIAELPEDIVWGLIRVGRVINSTAVGLPTGLISISAQQRDSKKRFFAEKQ